MMEYSFNKYLSTIELLNLELLPDEIQELFYDFINNVPFIRNLISIKRKKASDLEKDDKGRIKVDLANPHILENMDYFRLAAIKFEKDGRYTDLRPNPNPNSEYGKWIREEVRRCYEGLVRPSDGEWITGDYYYFLNYAPMSIVVTDEDGLDLRVIGFPKVWEGHYLLFHYLELARRNKKHAFLLASRARGKSFVGASMMSKRFLLGESKKVNKKVICYITASDKKYLDGGDLTLNKFVFDIDHCAINTQFPSRKLINSLNDMQWISGYKDLDTGTNRGTLNAVIGVSSSKDESKLRGTRGVLYILEEAGTFSKLLDTYGNLRHSVEQGKKVYGTIFAYGTAGDKDSDFSSMLEIMYSPNGYNVLAIPNVYDKEGLSRAEFVYFFPGYLNYEGYYNENGVSNVTGAILELLKDRFQVKYNSTEINAITKRIAESPIVPQEAILRTRGNIFPVSQLNERIAQIDNNPNEFDDVYVGDLVLNPDGSVKFVPTNNTPLRNFPLKQDTPTRGSVEIFQMPEVEHTGKINPFRYGAGFDPYDNDLAESKSLGSIFIMDFFTDKIVAEYTGRTTYAEECYEILRMFCLFYNCKCLYESNKKGTFAYFSKMNCTHLLADTPEYLRDKQLVKYSSFGSNSKGVNASLPINNYANLLIKDWLLKPVPTIVKDGEEEKETTISNLYFVRNRALLKELVLYNPHINVDRIRALGMLMLYREEKMVLFLGDMSKATKSYDSSYAGNDDFFNSNYP